MRKRIYFSTIDKDVRRVIGKKLYQKSEEERGFIVTERSNGDAEYYLNKEAGRKLYKYLLEHRSSRLARANVGISEFNNHWEIRFEIDSWQ